VERAVRLVIALEQHFLRGPDGRTWTATDLPRRHWERYLRTFDEVRVVARVSDVAVVDRRWTRVDGEGVTVAPVPDYVGPAQYLRRSGEVRRAVRAALGGGDAVILRVPGTLGTVAAGILAGRSQPFGVEVVGDPHEVFAPGTIDHPLRALFRWSFSRALRHQCREAAAVQYVTRSALQRRYPAGALAVGASDVELAEEAFAADPGARRERPWGPAPDGGVGERVPFRLIAVGSMAQPYKGHDLAVRAVRLCRDAGLDVELVIVGDGRLRPELERLTMRLGLRAHVTFRGQLPAGEAVRRELDDAHLFVMPSRVEGLPRALVEAMARALPAVGTAVGGIPELLAPEALVPTEDVAALADRISRLFRDAGLRARLGRQGWATAREYREEALRPRREAFHRAVADAARAHAEGRR
jgi:glycosyltransferase involved in cell wall biosynthesis